MMDLDGVEPNPRDAIVHRACGVIGIAADLFQQAGNMCMAMTLRSTEKRLRDDLRDIAHREYQDAQVGR
jgi:hypothetical protein